jgi:ATP-dependent RNA helicase DeaD
VRIVVLDEADRMLDMGFIKAIENILSKIPVNRQISLFSATIDQSVMDICSKYMKQPEKILVSKDEIALPQMSQYYLVVNLKTKLQKLYGILDDDRIKRAILFCRTRSGTDILANKLRMRGYDAESLHGGFTQQQRDFVVNSFRKGELKFLVATDVAARGLDIQGITHIINYDLPLDALVYFHRIGRTARMESEGTAITLVDYEEMSELNRIKALTKTKIVELTDNSALGGEFQKKMYDAVCTNCRNECQVPFKPDQSRPLYCKKCNSKIRLRTHTK